jgi:hypothetical protein
MEPRSDLIQEGHVFKLQKAIYDTKQAAWQWHIGLSNWTVPHTYDSEAINCEMVIFIKRDGVDFF